MKIGILGAMQVETEIIRHAMKNVREESVGGMHFIHGTWAGHDVIVSTCGIGKVSAAMNAQTMVLHYSPSIIINTGVAGSVDPSLHVLDVVIATATVQHDVDTSPLGDPVGMISGINLVEVPCDFSPIRTAVHSLLMTAGNSIREGIIASGDQFIASSTLSARIRDTFRAIAVDMESGAIAQVCYMNHVPCCVIRTISDGADDMEYTEFLTQAAQRSAHLLRHILENVR